mgnify:FL=1
MSHQVLIVMGSDSDYPVLTPCLDLLDTFDIQYQVRICSAHRSPQMAADLAVQAESAGFSVIIAAAGLAAHLPGVLAAWTTLPVIGVPIESGPLAGQDALYAVVQMPPGVPVATVGINGSVNAAILAAQIIGVHHDDIRRQLHQYKATLRQSVSDRQKKIDQILNDRQVKTRQSLS